MEISVPYDFSFHSAGNLEQQRFPLPTSGWRSPIEQRAETLARVSRQLQIAMPSDPPMFCLALDEDASFPVGDAGTVLGRHLLVLESRFYVEGVSMRWQLDAPPQWVLRSGPS